MPDFTDDLAYILPYHAPACASRRLLLFGIRRMASHGLNDAHAASAMIGGFGIGFRRPLVLTRALMAEISRTSAVRLAVAPCCCPRMTGAEAVLLSAVVEARSRPRDMHDALAGALGIRDALGPLITAQALGQAFEDLGRPL